MTTASDLRTDVARPEKVRCETCKAASKSWTLHLRHRRRQHPDRALVERHPVDLRPTGQLISGLAYITDEHIRAIRERRRKQSSV